jgi:hypothetical protein
VTADELIAVVRLDEDGRTRGVDPVRQAPLALVKAAVALRGDRAVSLSANRTFFMVRDTRGHQARRSAAEDFLQEIARSSEVAIAIIQGLRHRRALAPDPPNPAN